jgi:hypothetical protein
MDPTTNGVYLNVGGNGVVLFDHNSVEGCTACEPIHNLGVGSSGWTDDVFPGSAYQFYLEDNTFCSGTLSGGVCIPGGGGISAIQSYYAGRTVFRHNTLDMAYVDQHGTCGNVYARWWEVYNNIHFILPNGASLPDYAQLRGGSGVIFGNNLIGTNLSTAADIILTEGTSFNGCGSIVPQSVGGGREPSGTRVLSPAYVWGNATAIPVDSDGGVTLNRDYYVATNKPSSLLRCQSAADAAAGCPVSYNYVPFTYPYPLTAAGLPNPASLAAVNPPTNLQVASVK